MHQQQTFFENIVDKGEIAGNKQLLLFSQCFLVNQIIVSPFVDIFDISLFAAKLEEPKIGISGKGLILYYGSLPINCSVLEPVRMGFNFVKDGIWAFLSLFTMSNIKNAYRTFRKMTYWQLFVAFLKLNFRIAFMILTVLFHIVW